MQVGDKGRPPRGGRGLKYNFATDYHATQRSPPSRGAWIEISGKAIGASTIESPPSRGAWIEITISQVTFTI